MSENRIVRPLDMPVPTRENTAAVVVLYFPDGDLFSRMHRVLAQVGRLIVIANDRVGKQRLDHSYSEVTTYIENSRNDGLAAALNQGLLQARQQGFAWCLLLDQDTLVDENLMRGLASTFDAFPMRERIGLLVPNYRSPGGGRTAYRTDVVWQTVATAVTSGSLVPLAVIDRVGGMLEQFFIESIDLEFCLRAGAVGLLVVASGQPLMTHGAGNAEERRFLGRKVLVSHHPPWRCFLQYRNLTWTMRRYFLSDPWWVAKSTCAMIKRIILVLVFEKYRYTKLKALFRGMAFGISGNLDNKDILLVTFEGQK